MFVLFINRIGILVIIVVREEKVYVNYLIIYLVLLWDFFDYGIFFFNLDFFYYKNIYIKLLFMRLILIYIFSEE